MKRNESLVSCMGYLELEVRSEVALGPSSGTTGVIQVDSVTV